MVDPHLIYLTMIKPYVILLISTFSVLCQAQTEKMNNDTLQLLNNLEWLSNLNEKGLEIDGDSIKIGKDFQKLLTDSAYFNTMYPDNYSWEQTMDFIQKQELKEAFWYMINLYPESEKNKELVLRSVITYDQILKMDEVMVNAFNTFCYADPEISRIENDRPEIVHPDIFELKLGVVKEIVGYVQHYRTVKTKQ